MKVVTMYGAAKIAGVSKQAIFDLKKRNAEGKSNYSFFCYDSKTGKHGINIDDIEWKQYLDRGKDKRSQVKPTLNHTKDESISSKQDNTALFMNLINAVEQAIIQVFNPGKKQMDKVKELIVEKYRGLND